MITTTMGNNNNNFDTDAATANGAASAGVNKVITLTPTTEVPSVGYQDKKEILFMASVKGPQYETVKRAPIDVIAVVDRSGSMSGPKIQLTNDTLQFVIGQLGDKDRLGIIT
eukprot:GEZU01015061.1.p1 GENE.GEZU01015061.1~~GEZU01015061.1.p1  ORF type:complete len:112 (+),score=26.11 GEZU01015061.1:74-409(+)